MPVYTSSIEVTADYPTIKPSLNLNFARSRSLDPRITFTRASTATYVGRDGLVKYAGVDEARFDHDPDTLESLGLLLEESRTNIALYSQEFNNVYWSKSGGGNPGTTVTANQAVAPDGTTTADYIDYTTAIANSQNIERSYDATPAGKTYTASVWIKGTSGQTINLTLDANGVSGSAEQFTLNGNWQRFSITRTYPAGSPDALFRFGTRNLGHPSTGTATQIYAWGAQIELGSFPTSYIPTSGSAVTRAVDDATIVGGSFNSFYNQNEGSLFVESTPMHLASGINHRLCVITGDSNFTTSSAPGGINVDYEGTTLRTELFSGSPNSAQAGTGLTVSTGSKNKLAYGLETNNVSVFVNGAQVGTTDTSAPMPSPMTKMGIGRRPDISTTYASGVHMSSIQYYPKRLTNAQLQLLTS